MIEIGDEFIINKKYTGCKYPNKKFIAKRLSHSNLGVYFDDFRTNIKCKCSICRFDKSWGTDKENKNEKYTQVDNVIVVKKAKQRNREIALNLLFGKKIRN